jgi:hypothetical protein
MWNHRDTPQDIGTVAHLWKHHETKSSSSNCNRTRKSATLPSTSATPSQHILVSFHHNQQYPQFRCNRNRPLGPAGSLIVWLLLSPETEQFGFEMVV